MRKHGLVLMTSILMACGPAVYAQTPPPAADRSGVTSPSADITYGRVKELTPGQKIVIDVDNKIDKSFDLTEKDKTFHLAKGLKVGDPVMVTERERNGKKMVDIAKHSGEGVKHGDKTRAEEIEQQKK